MAILTKARFSFEAGLLSSIVTLYRIRACASKPRCVWAHMSTIWFSWPLRYIAVNSEPRLKRQAVDRIEHAEIGVRIIHAQIHAAEVAADANA